jgi:hypothetical protein
MAFSTRSKAKQTEIIKEIASLIQIPADFDVDANDIIIVPVKPEKPNQILLILEERLNLAIEHQKNYHVDYHVD